MTLRLKRLIDILVSGWGLLILSPLFVIVSIGIVCTMGMPIFFRQKRPGLHGRPFLMLKFRTMREMHNKEGRPLPDAERLTWLGQFLRRTSLDELPELYNVLRGDMSLVGPRPLLIQYLTRYTPEQARRHEVKPGITGWAQINGRNDVSWEARFKMDVWYVDHQSVWLDLKILLRTLAKVVSREGISAQGHATMPEFQGSLCVSDSQAGGLGSTSHASQQGTLMANMAGRSTHDRAPRTREVLVYGAGGHGKVVAEMLVRSVGGTLAGFIDDDEKTLGTRICDSSVLGNADWLSEQLRYRRLTVVVAIGDNAARQLVSRRCLEAGSEIATVIHPEAHVSQDAIVGRGAVIMPGSVVNVNASIGDGVIVNSGAVVEHDAGAGEFAHISPNATVGGGAQICEGAHIGMGAVVLPGIRIGKHSVVGAGAVVVKDVPDGVVVMGVPARVVRSAAEQKDSSAQLISDNNRHPVRTRSFAPWPYFGREEIESATAVLRSGKVNYWTGKEGRLFESDFASLTGCDHAIALANGTVALELALYALDIGPGDEVIVPSRTFIASASSIVMRGATPVVADVHPTSQNLTAEAIAAALSPRTKAVVAVHLAGWPCEMDPLMELAEQHGIKVIEDCAQAHGATYKGRPVGSLGHVAAFSFCQDKILTTGGEGGMLTTNDEQIWSRAWSFKDHGKSWDAVHHEGSGEVFRWLHESFGTNWRLTEMQAAIGRVVLRKLPEWIEIRRRNAAVLTERFARIPALQVTVPPEHIGHSFYKYYTFLRPEWLRPGWSRDRVVKAIQAEGIPCGSGACAEIYRERAFEQQGLGPAKPLPVAKQLGETSLMFLVHPTLTEEDMVDTCQVVEKVVGIACVEPPAEVVKWPSRAA